MKPYRALSVAVDGQVATIRMLPLQQAFQLDPPADLHVEMPDALEELRTDHSIRVIVITGAHDDEFLVTPPVEYYTTPRAEARLADPYGAWHVGLGVVRCCQVMTEIEKPIIAKVNGDAIGLGQSLVFLSDLIVAREDAIISDVHLGMGEVTTSAGQRVGLPFGVVPGDGAGAVAPLFMTPTQAKEHLMLSPSRTAAELAAARIVNRAVPRADLDAVTDDFVARLLARSAFALAWTKRIVNRRVADQLNLTLDASIAYEQLGLAQIRQLGHDNDPRSLTRPESQE
ncbi:MAG TPA: enoyl-CoA hydratase/isomerase family protein [Candidatus Dormibacteraeota bacterium]|jgi:enoyl-CoA hydratase/carnithine racemase|nr:enoyl-CoA hydratase/isomerase family protein [Candidatus Dormibacteraeota bacterium]